MSTCAELFISEFSACIIFALLLIFSIIMYFLKKFKEKSSQAHLFPKKRWHNDLMMQFLRYEAYGHLCNERVYLLAWSTLFDDENNLMSCLSLKKVYRYHFWTFSSQDVSSTWKLCKIFWISEALIEFIVLSYFALL